MRYKRYILVLTAIQLSLQLLYSQEKAFTAYQQEISGTDLIIDMVPIKGGSFLMGSPDSQAGHKPDEGPLHRIVVDPFWMAKLEISWDLYRLFMEREIDQERPAKAAGNEVDMAVDGVAGATTPYVDMSFGMGTDGYPAVCMTQYAASQFCEWLSAMTGNFYRLPTEAEWEYACRAGTDTSYSFGKDANELEKYAWFSKNSDGKYQQVGQKKPNPWGLHDMHGNVSEWTLDQYLTDIYQNRDPNQTINPFEKPTKTYPRSVRGGSWKDGPEALRSASRAFSVKRWKMRDPQIPKSKWWHTDAAFVGFRIVRPYKTPPQEDQSQYWQEKHSK